jgi:hypothetical protein
MLAAGCARFLWKIRRSLRPASLIKATRKAVKLAESSASLMIIQRGWPGWLTDAIVDELVPRSSDRTCHRRLV